MTARERLLHWLRVPAAPSAPAGDTGVQVFRASHRYFHYRTLQWFLRTLGGAVGLAFAIRYSGEIPRFFPAPITFLGWTITRAWMEGAWYLLEVGAVAGFIAQAVAGLVLLRLDFEQRWYIASDRSLRIREGLLRMHEKTMTFANVQQVSIRQGPLQRLLGIADLRVQTAGGGSGLEADEYGGAGLHVAYFRGIANANAVRDTILEKLRQFRDAGLGDPDEPAPDTQVVAAARAFAAEAASLRLALLPPGPRSTTLDVHST